MPAPKGAGQGLPGEAVMTATLHLQQGMSRLGTESAFEVLARANALAAQGKSIIRSEERRVGKECRL